MLFSFETILRRNSEKFKTLIKVETKFVDFSLYFGNCIFVFCFGIYPKPLRGIDFNFGLLGVEIDFGLKF